MNNLKQDIFTLNKEEQLSTIKIIHQNSTVLERISGSISKFFGILAAALNSQRTIPVIGSITQLIAIFPKSLSIITDPEKSTSEKIFASVFLGTLFILTTTALILGAKAAVFLGVAVSAIVTFTEGINLVSALFAKYNAASVYNKKLQFNELIENRTVPKSNEFNELLEIRFVELTHKMAKERLNKEAKSKLSAEYQFITELLKIKHINPAALDKKASLLTMLYKKREQQFNTLVTILTSITPESPLKQHINDIKGLQNEISAIDTQIKTITAPIETLDQNNMMASEQLALTFSNCFMASTGTLLSVLGLLLMLGSVAMPQVFVPIIFGCGIALAALSLIKFITEKYDEYQDKKEQKQLQKAHEEILLDEALYRCDLGQTLRTHHDTNSSHAKYMQELITTSSESHKSTPDDQEKRHHSGPLFSKPQQAVLEGRKEPERNSKAPP